MEKSGSKPRSLAGTVLHVVYVFLSMSGWRLDHLNVAWVVGGALSLGGGYCLTRWPTPVFAIPFFLFALLFYYVGNSLFLVSNLPARMIARWGEERAYRIYETVLALMFINQGLGVGAIGALELGPAWAVPLPLPLIYVVGGVACAIGIVVKVWATVVVGIDVYYYKDMFLRRPVSEFVSTGPYRVFRNPMYGIGQLHAYGIGLLMNRNLNGLLAAAICHSLIYVFYFAIELPFIRRTYLTPAAASASTEARVVPNPS